MKNEWLFFFLASLLFSCQSDTEISPFTASKKPFLLAQQTDNQKVVKTITYNLDQQVASTITYDAEIIRSEMQYTNKRLTRQNDFYPDGSSAGYKLYFYDFYGLMDRIDHYKPDIYDYTKITLHHYETFEYNTQHQLTKSSYYHSHGAGELTIDSYNEYEYDTKGNLLAHRVYSHKLGGQGDMVLAVTGAFEFDDKANPFPLNGIQNTDKQTISKNNLIKATYKYPNGNVYPEFSFEANYTYYEHGFPQKAVFQFANGKQIERQWEYQKAGE